MLHWALVINRGLLEPSNAGAKFHLIQRNEEISHPFLERRRHPYGDALLIPHLCDGITTLLTLQLLHVASIALELRL